jgi:signal transduction histidine kinase
MVVAAAGMLRNAARRTPGADPPAVDVDPALEIVYPRTGSGPWIDGVRWRDSAPPADSGRVLTPIERDGKPIAALAHDPALSPERLQAAVEAASLAIDNELLKTELQAQLRDVQASRTRIVEAADAERRRVERNLHDGAQQRLVGLALTLRLAGRGADPTTTELLTEAMHEVEDALADLRQLGRGVHPAIVTDVGLGGALDSLAERPGLPVDLSVDLPYRLPDAVEVAAYYVVAEALTNTNKHARAARVAVRATIVDGTLRVSVSDDGRGGAVAGPGSGLEGLADRVNALGGQLVIDSPADCGTVISVDIPLHLPLPERDPRALSAFKWIGWENWLAPGELYDQITEEDLLNAQKMMLLCAGGNRNITEREREWLQGYLAAAGDPPAILEAIRTYDDSDALEDLMTRPSMSTIAHAFLWEALRIRAADGPLTEVEVQYVRAAAARLGYPDDLVTAFRELVEAEQTLRQRRYELITIPVLRGAR